MFEMTTLILGVLGSRLSLNVINIVVIVDSYGGLQGNYNCFISMFHLT